MSPGRPELEVDLMAGDLRFAVALDYQRNSDLHRSHSLIEHGVVNSMTVGVYGSTSPFGILTVHSTIAREFSPDDLQFMELASTTISVAVERQRGRQQQKMLLGRLVDAQEAERNAIAIKIHDDAVQVMTAVNLRGALFQRALTNPAQIDARDLQETVSLAIGRLRNLLVELRPPALDRHGLAAGFKTHLDQFQAVTGVRCEFTAELDDEPVPEVRILLFRIFQEALTNVRKHAKAESVVVSLTSVDGGVRMRVTDDGDGCPQSALEPRVGLLGVAAMRERAEIAGGWWG
jgi:signal transduction histidine kinase